MSGRDVALYALLCCLGSGLVRADDRFYQIVDPDGHVRTVRAPAAATSGQDQAPAAAPASAPAAAPAPAATVPSAPAAAVAPYDSDVYTDSEALDAAGANPEKKKRFFIINDSTGSHVQQQDDEAAAPEPVKESPAAVVPMTDLPDETREWSGPDLFRQFPALDRCLAAKERARATELKPDQQLPLLVDRRTRLFVRGLGLIKAFRLDGTGAKTVVVRSYAGADVKPGFVRPYLAFAGRDGCLTRLLTGYFQHRRGATQSRHGMLEGSLIMHDGEVYLLVLMPEDKRDEMSPPATYSLSADGQLSIKWQP